MSFVEVNTMVRSESTLGPSFEVNYFFHLLLFEPNSWDILRIDFSLILSPNFDDGNVYFEFFSRSAS